MVENDEIRNKLTQIMVPIFKKKLKITDRKNIMNLKLKRNHTY